MTKFPPLRIPDSMYTLNSGIEDTLVLEEILVDHNHDNVEQQV